MVSAGRPVGVLAIQGDHAAHQRALEAVGRDSVRVKTAAHLEGVDGLVLPGGESTTMLAVMRNEGLLEPLAAACRSGMPVLGTCAGAILLAQRVLNPEQTSLGVLDMTVERNGYGRQLHSFVTRLGPSSTDASFDDLEAVFIRAPIIRDAGDSVTTVLEHDGHPVLVRSGSVWAATFHPEMTSDTRIVDAIFGR